jgi:hypothetical protein
MQVNTCMSINLGKPSGASLDAPLVINRRSQLPAFARCMGRVIS